MDCPRCRCALSTRKLGQVEAQACETCGGIRLEHGTLDRIAEPHDGDLEFSMLDREWAPVRTNMEAWLDSDGQRSLTELNRRLPDRGR